MFRTDILPPLALRAHLSWLLVLLLAINLAACSNTPSPENGDGTGAGAGAGEAMADGNARLAQARQLIVENNLYEAQLVLTEVIDADPSNATALMLRGVAHMRDGKLYPAVKDLKAAADLAPSADSYFNLGNVMLQAGFYRRAATAFRAALELAPEDPEILNNFASSLVHSGQNAEARQVLGRVIDLRPNDPQGHTLLGVLSHREDNFRAAEQHYNRALQVAPDYWPAQFNLAKTFEEMGNEAMASEHYARYLKMRPNAPDRLKIMKRANLTDQDVL